MDQTSQVVPDTWRDLSAGARDALLVLAYRGRLTATGICAAVGRPDAHPKLMTRHLESLEGAGYVTAEPAEGEPGRGTYWELTDDGWGVIHDAPVRVE